MTTIRVLVSLLISGLLMWIAFGDINLNATIAALNAVEAVPVIVYFATLVLMHVMRMLRWNILIQPYASISLRALFRINNEGTMLMVLLPFRMGELARPYLLAREAGVSVASGIATIAAERCLDGLIVAVLFFSALMGLPASMQVPEHLRLTAVAALIIFSVGLILLVIAMLATDTMERILRWTGYRLSYRLTETLIAIFNRFIVGLRSLPDAAMMIKCVVLTVLFWGIHGLGFTAMNRAFGWELPALAGQLIACTIALALLIPAGPAYLGTYQAGIMLALALFHISPTEAAAYGMVVYPLNIFQVVLFGLPHIMLRRHAHTRIPRRTARPA